MATESFWTNGRILLLLFCTRLTSASAYTVTDRIALLQNLFDDITPRKQHSRESGAELEQYGKEPSKSTSGSQQDGPELRYEIVLDNEQKFYLRWDIEEPTETITFKLDVALREQNFFVFGFSDYGESENADLVVFWTDLVGNHFFQVSMAWLHNI